MPSTRRLIHVIAISGAGQSYRLRTPTQEPGVSWNAYFNPWWKLFRTEGEHRSRYCRNRFHRIPLHIPRLLLGGGESREEFRGARAAKEEAEREGTTPLADFKKELGL